MRAVIADRLLASPGRVALTRALLVALVALVVTSVLAATSDLYAWEQRLTDRLVDLPDTAGSALRVVMQAGNRLAVAAVALLFLIADRPRRAAVALIGGWGAWLVAVLLKGLVDRPRPSADLLGFSPEEFVSGSGFPSSHTTVAVALATVIVTASEVPRSLKVLSVAAAVLTALARVELAVHWPLDVVGGAAVGVLVAGVVVVALDPAPVPEAWPGVGLRPPVEPAAVVTGTGRPEALRVATFNVRNGWSLDWGHAWWFRRGSTAATIRALDADLVALQEAYAFQRRWLEREVGGRGWVGVGRTDGRGRGEQCPLTWRPDRLELESWEARWFSEDPGRAGSRLAGARHPRMALLARFRDRQSGRRFGVVNAHLDSRDRTRRLRSAELLTEWLAEGDGPWIVLGDLNDEVGSPPLELLGAAGYRPALPGDGRGTAHQFTGREDGPHIDHILVGDGWSAENARVRTVTAGPLPSDHWPLVAELGSAGR